jgi:hypothetical protein
MDVHADEPAAHQRPGRRTTERRDLRPEQHPADGRRHGHAGQVSYVATRLDYWGTQSATGSVGANSGVPTPATPQTPNDDYYPKTQWWENSLRVSGSYEMPWGIQTAAVMDHQSGEPYNRFVRFTQGLRQLSQVYLRVEERGAKQLPDVNLVTLRGSKRFQLAQGQNLTVRVDIFNLLNSGAYSSIIALSGPTYGQIENFVGPRIAAFGATYSF